MPSDVSICNSALIKIGCEKIGSLSENNKRAINCNEQYPKIRDLVLFSHDWKFAKRRAALTQVVPTPAFEFDYAYALPPDCLRIIGTDTPDVPYKIEGTLLLTDLETFNIKYISSDMDSGSYPPSFCEVVAFRLAQDLAYSLAQSVQLSEQMGALYDKSLKEAKAMDSQQGSADSLEASEWLDSRW